MEEGEKMNGEEAVDGDGDGVVGYVGEKRGGGRR